MLKLSERLENHIWVKREDRQPVHSFKLRGAYAMIAGLSRAQKEAGVIAASAGNHAQGVAYAAQKLGVAAVICMPATTPILKVEATRALGATVILHGNGFDDAYAHSLSLQKEKGFVYIHPFNDRDVIVGQGTIALEIIDALKDVDAILVPVGGGGLVSGVALGTKLVNPHVKIIGVEPENAACMKAALSVIHGCRIVACDMVELSPPLDASGASTATALKLLREMLLAFEEDFIRPQIV